MKPLAHVWYFPGTQCERETLKAYNLAGFRTRLVFIDELLTGKVKSTDCDVCHFPGGFSYNDSPRVAATAVAVAREEVQKLKEKNIPTGGNCNGFQFMVEAGMFGPEVALVKNDCKTFVSRPVRHQVIPSKCIWLDGMSYEILEFPAAHGYGKLIGSTSDFSSTAIIHQARVAMLYEGNSPNGGVVAAITNHTGAFLGLMDHWERPYNNPAGQAILANLKKHL